MTLLNNPFVTSGYIAPEYFCDREKETEELLRWLVNENNVAIISTRRMGKTGLIQHCFHLKEIKENYLQDGVQTELKHEIGFDDFIVPENCIFAMGDNRAGSIDCRDFGCIPLEKIEGTVWIRIFPFNKFGKI